MMNHLWDISIYQIQIFLKAAEFRSFSLAAAHLNTTQSTVSKSIAATEAALGFALFIRTRSGVELTLSGARLFDQWKNLVSSMESSYHKVSSEFLHGIQILRVGIPDSFADGEEQPYVQKFIAAHPNVQIIYYIMPAGQLARGIMNGELDLILTGFYERSALESLGCHWKSYIETPSTVFMHRTNPLSSRPTLSVRDLSEEDFYMLSPTENSSYYEQIHLLCQEHGFQPQLLFLMPNFRSMVTNLIRSKKGVLISNRFLYSSDHPDLRCLPLQDTVSGMIIAWKPSSLSRPLQDLIEAFPSCSK